MINFEVDSGELLRLLKFVKTLGQKTLSKHHIKLSFNSNYIELSFPEGSYKLVANSDASGTAMIPGAALVALLKTSPKSGVGYGYLVNGEISLGSTKISNPEIILKLGVGNKELSLPINPEIKDILALRNNHTTEEIRDWGLERELRKAEKQFEKVLEKVAGLMLPYLPTSITKNHLRALVAKELTED